MKARRQQRDDDAGRRLRVDVVRRSGVVSTSTPPGLSMALQGADEGAGGGDVLDDLGAHDDVHGAARLVVVAQVAQLDGQFEGVAAEGG